MVFNRSKYLRGREGPEKGGGWELGRGWVGSAWGRLLFQKTPAVFLIGRDPTQPPLRTPAQARPCQIFTVCLYT